MLPKLLEVPLCGIPKITEYFISKEETIDDDVSNPAFKITTQGSNLKEARKKYFIDQKSLQSNNLIDIYENFGLEAARKFLLDEIRQVLGVESIQDCHIKLLVDTMTAAGEVFSPRSHATP